MIDIDPKVQVDLYGYVAISQLIGDLLPSTVDVSERRALRPTVRSTAERDAVFAF